jgi:hypothetical protein
MAHEINHRGDASWWKTESTYQPIEPANQMSLALLRQRFVLVRHKGWVPPPSALLVRAERDCLHRQLNPAWPTANDKLVIPPRLTGADMRLRSAPEFGDWLSE